jgi:hypothetical protein
MIEQFICTTVGIQFVFAGKYQFCVSINGLSFFWKNTFILEGSMQLMHICVYLFIYLFDCLFVFYLTMTCINLGV